jgi:hypothetical protein
MSKQQSPITPNFADELQAKDIVEDSKHHKRQNDRQTKRHQPINRDLVRRASKDRFIGKKHQMTAIQNRDRK